MRSLTPERLTGMNLGLASAGVLVTAWLVTSELFREPVCPLLLGIPACYVVLAGYLGALAGAWFPDTKPGSLLVITGAGVVTLVGAWFSFNQLTGALECPTLEGLPMCYVSLLAGAMMLATDQLRRRLGPSSRGRRGDSYPDGRDRRERDGRTV